jgi:DNA-binding protein H-NS
MTNLLDIQSQIDKLQKQADDIKTRDFDKTVADILVKMKAFGITVKDLSPGKRGRVKSKASVRRGVSAKVSSKGSSTTAPRPTGPVAAKFKGPNGESWSGRGLTPRWLAALVAQGKSKEDFVVQS